MSPPIIKDDVLELESINPHFTFVKNGVHSINGTPFGEREKINETRITLFHVVIHLLAFFIIVPFVFLIIYNRIIPPEYSTIVSVVVGFYFGRALFKY